MLDPLCAETAEELIERRGDRGDANETPRSLRRYLAAGMRLPIPVRGEEKRGVPKVGVLHINSVEETTGLGGPDGFLAEWPTLADRRRGRLREFRFGNGRIEALPGLVRSLLDARVDIIVSNSEGVFVAAKLAGATPVVASLIAGDPVALGLAESLANPGRTRRNMYFSARRWSNDWKCCVK